MISEAHRITRDLWVSTQEDLRRASNKDMDDALTALDGSDPNTGKTDHDVLNALIKKRYARGLKKAAAEGDYDEYVISQAEAAIDQYVEHVLTRMYRKIVTAKATLHTQADQRFRYLSDKDANEDIAQLVGDMREDGGAFAAMIRADRLSVALGSSVLRMVWTSSGMRYCAHAPQVVYVSHTPRVFDNGDERGPDYTDLEDAAVVAIYLGEVATDGGSSSDSRFLAYFGRSDGYPDGRMVTYHGNRWCDIPEPGAGKIVHEYKVGDKPANPLTWAQNQLGTEVIPYEYPLVRYIGDDAGHSSGVALPTNGLALFRDCLELDIAWSKILGSATEAAKDVILVTNEKGAPLPENLSGAIALKDGQDAKLLGLNAGNSVAAASVLKDLSAMLANGWSVPSHMVVPDPGAMAPSGYSIALKSQPLLENRRERVELNRSSVAKMFDIERSLVAAHDDAESIPTDIRQEWDPGEWRPPVNKAEQLEELKAAKELGLIDMVGMVREYYDLADEESARQMIDAMKEREAEYPTKSEQPAPGRLPGLPTRRPRGIVGANQE